MPRQWYLQVGQAHLDKRPQRHMRIHIKQNHVPGDESFAPTLCSYLTGGPKRFKKTVRVKYSNTVERMNGLAEGIRIEVATPR
jgi:hypothetical protein